MTDFLLNECGDLDYTTTPGQLTVVTGVDAIRQRWLIYIRTFLGEWFLDQSIGVPYIQRILSKGISRQVIKQVFTTASLEVPGVIQVVSVIIDELIVATRFAEVTVTVIVTGDEGPETGVFKFTGTIPPDGCGAVTSVPEDIADQWYWFDANDLDFVSGANLAGDPGLPYVPGTTFQLDNKFEDQQGTCVCAGLASNEPEILPVINGRKAADLETNSSAAVAGFGINVNEVRALRASTGHNSDGRFTVFGVYRPDSAPTSYSPLMAINGVDSDGTTQRWINVRFRDNSGLQLQFGQDTVAGADVTIDSSVAGSVAVDEAWSFAMSYRFDVDAEVQLWINGVLVLDSITQGGVGVSAIVAQTGELVWNGGLDAIGDLTLVQSTNIGELVGYSGLLTDDEVAAMFAYLLDKWGI